ncbi:unnamed protein product [Litomosoides sigmodontis]|uniref:Uncharacterized protein n=1 Tax=Litomosoides sigmodontis TaxID=42156 RepID=A0A3P6V1D0_LITSI|nr:unnamed protein product [Litomosoides sigmodontis]
MTVRTVGRDNVVLMKERLKGEKIWMTASVARGNVEIWRDERHVSQVHIERELPDELRSITMVKFFPV